MEFQVWLQTLNLYEGHPSSLLESLERVRCKSEPAAVAAGIRTSSGTGRHAGSPGAAAGRRTKPPGPARPPAAGPGRCLPPGVSAVFCLADPEPVPMPPQETRSLQTWVCPNCPHCPNLPSVKFTTDVTTSRFHVN